MPGTCFVIQPFDRGPFDKRYHDILDPAIRRAGLEPYRVDLDPAVSIPIHEIERKIRDSDCCLADISADNPNVWYEVGYAFACGKVVVLICDSGRTAFPFDVRHRNILTYSTHSSSDFSKLAGGITARLLARTTEGKETRNIPPPRAEDVPTPHERAALAVLLARRASPGRCVEPATLSQEVQEAGFSDVAAVLAMEGLGSRGWLEYDDEVNGWGETYTVARLTEAGVGWCMAHQHFFEMKKQPPASRRPARVAAPPVDEEDDDIPF